MKYFTIKELSKSSTAIAKGIDNTPTPEATRNLTSLVDNVLDPLREAWGKPLYINSGYRSPALNKAVGGVATSQHVTGQAVDITASPKSDNSKLFKLIESLNLPYDQLIWEKGNDQYPDWIHISYVNCNRHQKLRYANGKYTPIP